MKMSDRSTFYLLIRVNYRKEHYYDSLICFKRNSDKGKNDIYSS